MRILHFEIPKKIDEFELIVDLKNFIPRVLENEEEFTRTFYDSHDWRLYRDNLTLEAFDDGSKCRLSLRNFRSEGEEAVLNVDSVPEFVWDLPSGVIRTKLEPILACRRLLAQSQLNCRRVILSQLNKNEKTVLRIEIDRNFVYRDDKEKRMGVYLNVVQVRGYPKPYNNLLSFLQDSLKLKPRKRKLLVQSLAAQGRHPLDYSSKLDVQLEPQMRFDAAVKLILLHLNATMLANYEGVLANLDSEFLHDFRISVRRTRSLLSQLKKAFPQELLKPFVTGFGWLGKVTGPARDLDVYLLSFDDYKAAIPVSLRNDLEPMRSHLKHKHVKAYEQLKRDLTSKRYRSLIENWQSFLDSPLAEVPEQKVATMPVSAVANRRIWRIYRKIIQDGQRITDQSPPESLHDLRKTSKKLRYTVEFFRSLYPDKQCKEAVIVLKRLQENLGAFQDYEVQVNTIKSFSQEMMVEKDTPVKALLAMGVLVQTLEKYSVAAREEFAIRFSEFESKKHIRLYEALFFNG